MHGDRRGGATVGAITGQYGPQVRSADRDDHIASRRLPAGGADRRSRRASRRRCCAPPPLYRAFALPPCSVRPASDAALIGRFCPLRSDLALQVIPRLVAAMLLTAGVTAVGQAALAVQLIATLAAICGSARAVAPAVHAIQGLLQRRTSLPRAEFPDRVSRGLKTRLGQSAPPDARRHREAIGCNRVAEQGSDCSIIFGERFGCIMRI